MHTTGGPAGAEVAVGCVALEGLAVGSFDLPLDTEAERFACGLVGLGPLRFLFRPMSWKGSRSCCHILHQLTPSLYFGSLLGDLSNSCAVLALSRQ